MKILAYVIAISGLSIAAYGAYFEGLPGDSHAMFGIALVIFASITHRESCSKQSS